MSLFTFVVPFVVLVAWLLQMPLLIGLLIERVWGSAVVTATIMAAELYVVCGGCCVGSVAL